MSILKVIKYDGDKNVLLYKHPEENMNNQSKLIVNEFQEAVFVKQGKILDVLSSGTYSLTTDNIPLLGAFLNLPYGKKKPFTAEVFFINKLHVMDIKWGTNTPIQLKDPKYNIIVPVRGYGQFGIKVDNSLAFMGKLIGNSKLFSVTDLHSYFRGIVSTKINDLVASCITNQSVSILEINAQLVALSDELKLRLKPDFDEFGIELVNFSVISINVPEDDPSVVELKKALSRKATMDVVGYTYDKERTYNALENASKNTGSGNFANASMGIPVGLAVGEFLKENLNKDLNSLKPTAGMVCKNCNKPLPPDCLFCPSCGTAAASQCRACNESVPAGSLFCPKCGTKI